MKKINIFELLSIGMIILIGCFIFSFAAKEMFKIDADFLSAAATFFAGVVAIKLFNDWRAQYRTELLERLKDRFNSLLIQLEDKYTELEDIVYDKKHKFNDPSVFYEVLDKVSNFRLLIENFQDELDFYLRIYIEFDLNNYKEIESPRVMLDGLREILLGISLSNNHNGDNLEYLEKLHEYIETRHASNKIVDYKIDLCRDLHLVIIDMITDKKGH
ncbi:hypothetical protein MKL32_03930 [Acinetobacter sp. AOR34_HL]|uniref:hypothetical protein n=1 Tax=Acinetobacter sp. AOR34_HL TaxID=2919384 RepID=UPI0022EA5DF6|nr:hypothetical protein [Acinetobacter sp. AOR34_HL]MDA3500762.1 hypothetical protein [Acinetobacter sp. AOR34_HL]